MKTSSILRGITAAAVAATALTAIVSSANAGGFAVREQSALHQGASFAGAASGSDLSTMYWNPAGVTVSDGINTASHNSLILGQSDITATDITKNGDSQGINGTPFPIQPNPALAHPNGANTGAESGNIASPALVGSSYANMQLGGAQNVYLGLSINAPFGLTTQPDNRNYAGSFIGRTSKVFNIVGTPTVGVKVMPGVAVAVGAQIGYMDAKFKFGNANSGNVFFTGDDYGLGWTAGLLLTPMPGTRIGIGYRSEIEYNLQGKFGDNVAFSIAGGFPFDHAGSRFKAETDLTTPDIVTLSITQDVAPNIRVMGTFEWTNWSDFSELPIKATEGGVTTALLLSNTLPTNGISQAGQTFATLDANWDDAWFASVGLEYDLVPEMTLRTGIAYEESPIQKNTQRLSAVPDNNRIWLSGGLSWALTPAMSVDASYTHIFVEDGKLERTSIANSANVLFADVEQSVDIISVGFNMKLGHREEEALK